MRKYVLTSAAVLGLLPFALPMTAAHAAGDGLRSDNGAYQISARKSDRKQRYRKVQRSRRPEVRRSQRLRRDWGGPAYYTYYTYGGYGAYGYGVMRDPLGLNPAVEYYRRIGRCVQDDGYGRYTFCDD